MGVFTITPRSTTLQPQRLNSPARLPQPQSHHVADTTVKWRGADNLGRGMQDLGRAMFAIAGDMAREKAMIRDNEAEAEFERMTRERMENPEAGILTRANMAGNTDALSGVVDEANDYFRNEAGKFLDGKGYSGDAKQRMMLRLGSVTSPFERMMSHTVLKKAQQFKVASADGVFNEKQQSWQGNLTDADLAKDMIDAYRASQVVRGLDDATVDANTDAIMHSMAYDMVSKGVSAAGRKQLDEMEALIDKGEGTKLLGANKTLSDRFAGKDPFAYAAGRRGLETVTAKDGILAAIAARRRELDRLDNETVEKVVNEGIRAASVIRDENGNYPADRLAKIEKSMFEAKRLSETMPKGSAAAANAAKGAERLDEKADEVAQEEIWDEYLEALKADPNANIYADGGKKNAYKGAGRKERLAEGVQQAWDTEREKAEKRSRQELKEAMDANENGLKTAWSQLTLMEAEGTISDTEAAYVQSQIWRKLRVCTMAETVSPEFSTSFQKTFATRLNDEEKDAVLKLYRAFGFKGEVGSDGLATAKTQKDDSADYYVPQAEGASEDDKIKIGHEDMYKYVQAIRDALRNLGPEADRNAAIEAVIKKAQVEWLKDGWFSNRIDENIASGVRTVMDYQREAKAAFSQRSEDEEEETEKKQ
jgi:hypothetical protein